MLSKTVRLSLLVLIVGIALYIVTFNGAPTEVFISGSKSFQASTGVVLICTFILGVLTAAIIAGLFALKSYFRERALVKRERRAIEFFEKFQEARNLSAVTEGNKARALWEDLVKKDPTSTIARIELARLLLREKRAQEALRVLDEARAHDPESLEILQLAAELNIALNNKTAALDNLALLLQKMPTVALAAKARDLAESLNRPEDALHYHEIIYSLGARDEDFKDIKTRLEYRILTNALPQNNGDQRKEALSKFLKKHKHHAPTLADLASIETAKGNVDIAAKHLAAAARASGEPMYWYSAAKLWLKNNMPESAIAAARAANREATGSDRLQTELDLIRLYIALSRLEEAQTALNNLDSILEKDHLPVTTVITKEILVLKALCKNRLGEHKEVSSLLSDLSKSEFVPYNTQETPAITQPNGAPSPVLSTP